MKLIYSVLVSLLLVANAAQAEVIFSPTQDASSDSRQIRVTFPESMKKIDSPFTVTCDPDLKGFGNWADNNTTWVYNLETETNSWGERAPLPGGASCSVIQNAEISSVSGENNYVAGQLKHSFIVEGPRVEEVLELPGFNNKLREENPVFLIVFDGDVNKSSVIDAGGSFLWYPISDGFPSEKMLLKALPESDEKAIFDVFADTYSLEYRNVDYKGGNWVLATVNRNLIPGSEVNLSLSGIKSAYQSQSTAYEKDVKLSVRHNFKSRIACSRYREGSSNCRPEDGLTVRLNADTKWGDVKNTVVTYVPQGSKDGKAVTVLADSSVVNRDWLGSIAFELGIELSDEAKVQSISFDKIRVAPNTTAKVVFPPNVTDVDGRPLGLSGYEVAFGSFSEFIRFPENLTVMERNVTGNSALPVTVLNLNQKISVLKSGNDKGNWEAVTNMVDIINLLDSYEEAQSAEWNDEVLYESPLNYLGIPFNEEEVVLTGEKNQNTFLKIPFGKQRKSGVYVAEIKSELSSKEVSAYSLTLLTDLNVHLKSGQNEAMAWVTSYSTGLPVANAEIKIYNCNKQVALVGTTNTDGIFKFPSNNLSKNCANRNSSLLRNGKFFVFASANNEIAFTHNNYSASARGASIYSAREIDYSSSEIDDGEVYIHSLVGVNLVKPGQSVPVQLTAVMPNQTGFTSVDTAALPQSVTVESNASDISYKFPLEWKNGIAEFTWEVPTSAELGSYSVQVEMPGRGWGSRIGTDIEVSEFKVPLMTASLSVGEGQLVNPSELKTSGLIQFANGIGAKGQNTEISYYFKPAGLYVAEYQGFDFVQGKYEDRNNNKDEDLALPNSEQLVRIEDVVTDSEGMISLDLGSEKLESGETVVEILSKAKRPYDLIVRMKYQDQMGEFQTASTGQTIYNASAYIGSNITRGDVNAEASLDVVAVGVDGKAYTNLLDLDIKVLKLKTHVIGEEVFGGFIKNTFETELIDTNWKPSCVLAENGVANCSAKEIETGSYVLSVVSKSTNQETYSKFKIDSDGVLKGEESYYYFDEEAKGVLVASDKESYKGGDLAKLSFESPFDKCTALVTLERQEVVTSYVDNNACENGFVEVGVSAENAPNIFASVYLVTGRADNNVEVNSLDLGKPTFNVGYSNLKVDWDKYALDVEVSMDKEEYKPGETAVAEVSVNSLMDGLTDSTVTLIAIEEKILELKDNNSMKVLEALMGQRGHSVSTYNMYNFLNSVAEVRSIEEGALSPVAASDQRKDGEEGGSGSELETFQRKLFDSLVTFQTNVPVMNGKAFVDFKLNDKLTKFKVFAVVSDASSKYGTGEANYVASQEVQTFSNIPSVARTGDKYPATVTVQNNGKQAQNLVVVVDYKLKDSEGNVSPRSVRQNVSIDKGESRSVSLGDIEILEGTTSADYAITVYNENSVIVDALTPPTQSVNPAVPLTVQDEFLMQMNDGPVEISLVKDQRALEGQGEIDTKVFSSIVSSTEYAVSQSIASDIFADLTPEGKLLKAVVAAQSDNPVAVKRAFDELLSQVDNKGFIKYFSTAQRGSFWLTTEMVQLVAMKPWAMDLMPESLRTKLFNSMVAVINGEIDSAYIAKESNVLAWNAAKVKAANALYEIDKSIGTEKGAEVVTDVVEGQAEFRKYSTGVVADMALLTAKVAPSYFLKSKVMKYVQEALIVVKDTSAVLKGEASLSFYGYSDETISTAKLVKALSSVAAVNSADSSANYLDNLVQGLVQSNRNGNWYTNRTKAWVLNGLIGFANTFESVKVSGSTSVSSSASGIASNVVWRDKNDSISGGLASAWEEKTAQVSVVHSGEGKPWVSVVAKAAVKLESANYQGLKITKVVTNKSNADGSFTAGDLIQVDITIENPANQPHVALFDPIPAGANILSDGWGDYSSAQKSYSGYKVYFNVLTAGTVNVSYQYQLNNPGTFNLPQTRVEALYEPGLFGEVPNKEMTVVK